MWAAENGYQEIVKLLLTKGADVNKQDNVSDCWLTSLIV